MDVLCRMTGFKRDIQHTAVTVLLSSDAERTAYDNNSMGSIKHQWIGESPDEASRILRHEIKPDRSGETHPCAIDTGTKFSRIFKKGNVDHERVQRSRGRNGSMKIRGQGAVILQGIDFTVGTPEQINYVLKFDWLAGEGAYRTATAEELGQRRMRRLVCLVAWLIPQAFSCPLYE